ncbi:hypothetical protein [Paenisporosarcina sp. NPDC076898]|uniref:hypothetical protein n=1 Tax=unclassified Paenisporosarcina TaxID=2642018 RepID=UPI003D024898
MLSRLEKYKKIQTRKKIVILVAAVVLSLGVGSGVKTSFADADASTLLINWFKNKESESIKEIDKAITDEKTMLLTQLKAELKNEMASAESELDEFTEQQKSNRIASLRKYANNLIVNLKIDNTEQKGKITSEINSIMNEAIAQMEKAVNVAPEKENTSANKENQGEAGITEPANVPATSTPNPAPIAGPVDNLKSDATASTVVENVQADQTIIVEEVKEASENN